MTLDQLNATDVHDAQREFERCCGSTEWAARMTAARPFATSDAMLVTADAIWIALDESDWREAFAAHPRIGERASGAGGAGRASGAGRAGVAGAAGRAGASSAWSAQEQAGVSSADDEVLDRLGAKNREYVDRFGYIFIVCATGKSADEMLTRLEQRLTNDPAVEIRVAAEEQRQITQLRLRKLLTETDV